MAAAVMKSHLRLFFVGILLSGLILSGLILQRQPALADRDALVRVAILQAADNFVIYSPGRYQIIDLFTSTALSQGHRLFKSRVKSKEHGLFIGDQFYPSGQIKIIPEKDIWLYYEDKKRRYRGDLEIKVQKNGELLVINSLGLEDYVKGILRHEVCDRWPLEVIKAQAVAARTYALHQMRSNEGKDYDLTSDIYSQVYGGRSAERYRTNIAAERTEDQVMLYQGKLLPAYFHAACGGKTEDVRALWKDDIPPLKGVVCHFCRNSPHYNWRRNYRLKDIQDILNTHGYKLGLLNEIKILQKTPSGRAKTLLITERDGPPIVIEANDFRNIVGPNLIKSNFYTIEMKGYYFDLIGHGWGHGVGLCQWGAFTMAKKRYDYQEILRYYYPGAQIGLYHETQ